MVQVAGFKSHLESEGDQLITRPVFKYAALLTGSFNDCVGNGSSRWSSASLPPVSQLFASPLTLAITWVVGHRNSYKYNRLCKHDLSPVGLWSIATVYNTDVG
ncbi:hypothetical protein IFM89_001937 [Coptis chinensis]|uniref:Uncharacterized protein n=1 Tax=Coptis chinensis TaxID=261450 RepID=A0A835HTQ2_9MAGN|nr:hypothetical protein IFM89_001937 [Coptis chinensis]